MKAVYPRGRFHGYIDGRTITIHRRLHIKLDAAVGTYKEMSISRRHQNNTRRQVFAMEGFPHAKGKLPIELVCQNRREPFRHVLDNDNGKEKIIAQKK